jgi:hypothetical protein
MSLSTFFCDAECVSALHGLVPALAESPDDEKLARAQQHLDTLSYQDAQDVSGDSAIHLSRTDIMEASRAQRRQWRDASRQLADLREDIQCKEREVQELSTKMPKPLDREAQDALVDACRVKRDLCVRNGALDPATADLLFANFVKDSAGNVNVVALSRSDLSGGGAVLAMALFDALKSNKPVPVGEQGITLPYLPPGSVKPSDDDEQRLRKKLMSMINQV